MSKTYKDKPIIKQSLRFIRWIKGLNDREKIDNASKNKELLVIKNNIKSLKMTQEQQDRLNFLEQILFSDEEIFTDEDFKEFEELVQLQLSEIEDEEN